MNWKREKISIKYMMFLATMPLIIGTLGMSINKSLDLMALIPLSVNIIIMPIIYYIVNGKNFEPMKVSKSHIVIAIDIFVLIATMVIFTIVYIYAT